MPGAGGRRCRGRSWGSNGGFGAASAARGGEHGLRRTQLPSRQRTGPQEYHQQRHYRGAESPGQAGVYSRHGEGVDIEPVAHIGIARVGAGAGDDHPDHHDGGGKHPKCPGQWPQRVPVGDVGQSGLAIALPPAQQEVGGQSHQDPRDPEVGTDQGWVQLEPDGHPTQHCLADDNQHDGRSQPYQGRAAARGEPPPVGGPEQEEQPQGAGEHHPGQGAVPELNERVQAGSCPELRGELPRFAVRPGGAPQPRPRQPDRTTGGDDPDLGEEIGPGEEADQGAVTSGRHPSTLSCTARAQCQRNQRRAARLNTPAQAASSTSGGDAGPRPAWVAARSPSPSAPDGSQRDDGPDGSTTPPPRAISTQSRFAPASTASVRKVPATRSARALNAAEPSATARIAGANPTISGRQPSPAATEPSTRIWTTCTPSTPRALPPSRPPGPRGVVASIRNAPARRSKPVAIAGPVKALEITARAMIPGARRSTRSCPGASGRLIRVVVVNKTKNSPGRIRFSSACSPCRSTVRVSKTAWEPSRRAQDADPGRGAASMLIATPVRSGPERHPPECAGHRMAPRRWGR